MEAVLIAAITALPATIAAIAALKRLKTGNGASIGKTVRKIDQRLERMEVRQEDDRGEIRYIGRTLRQHVDDRAEHRRGRR